MFLKKYRPFWSSKGKFLPNSNHYCRFALIWILKLLSFYFVKFEKISELFGNLGEFFKKNTGPKTPNIKNVDIFSDENDNKGEYVGIPKISEILKGSPELIDDILASFNYKTEAYQTIVL